MELCIIEHQPDAPAGLLAEWAVARGARIHTARSPAVRRWPDPRRFDAVVALGSDRSVHASDDPWIAAEIAFLRDAHQSDVAVLGVCFGAQALAAALGGCVAPAPCAEIGWYELAAPGRGPVGAGPWFEWHFDAFTLPSGAHELARTAAGAQAFRLGRSVGLQFHPEVTPAIVDGWLRTGRGDLDAQALDGESIRRQTARQAGAARRRAFALFDAIADGWG